LTGVNARAPIDAYTDLFARIEEVNTMDRRQLLERREQLVERLSAIRRDLGGGLDRDLEEQAQQLENQDTLMEIARVAEAELAEVDRQLDRLDRDGS
jgi:RNA polymerase-binding transcription factor DksA